MSVPPHPYAPGTVLCPPVAGRHPAGGTQGGTGTPREGALLPVGAQWAPEVPELCWGAEGRHPVSTGGPSPGLGCRWGAPSGDGGSLTLFGVLMGGTQ